MDLRTRRRGLWAMDEWQNGCHVHPSSRVYEGWWYQRRPEGAADRPKVPLAFIRTANGRYPLFFFKIIYLAHVCSFLDGLCFVLPCLAFLLMLGYGLFSDRPDYWATIILILQAS